jgi:hypothetical protein
MHAILAMASVHIEYLKRPDQPSQPDLATFHWQLCLSQFNNQISDGITIHNADALLVACTLINGLAYVMLDGSTLGRGWPLGDSRPRLGWLSAQAGLNLVVRLTFPILQSKTLQALFIDTEYDSSGKAQPEHSSSMPVPWPLTAIAKHCEVIPTTSDKDNPYSSAIKLLISLAVVPYISSTMFIHLGFITSLEPRLICLLEQKDTRALLLLAYWYANMCAIDCWWITMRAKLDCANICIYLQQLGDKSLDPLITYLANACGYMKAENSDVNDAAQILMPCTVS